METKTREVKIAENISNVESKNAILLKELITEINKYLTQNKQEIGCLADILKRIFYSGLTSLINVSKKSWALHQKRCIRLYEILLCLQRHCSATIKEIYDFGITKQDEIAFIHTKNYNSHHQKRCSTSSCRIYHITCCDKNILKKITYAKNI